MHPFLLTEFEKNKIKIGSKCKAKNSRVKSESISMSSSSLTANNQNPFSFFYPLVKLVETIDLFLLCHRICSKFIKTKPAWNSVFLWSMFTGLHQGPDGWGRHVGFVELWASQYHLDCLPIDVHNPFVGPARIPINRGPQDFDTMI